MNCVKVCVRNCWETVGREMTSDEVVSVVLRDRLYYAENGGMTVSGGEPLLQPDFTAQLLQKCAGNGIHTAIETALDIPFSSIEKILPHTKLFICDLKHSDDTMHRKFIGSGNKRIIENLKKLSGLSVFSLWVRMPFIPGVNTSEEFLSQYADILLSLDRLDQFEILKYHKMGNSKYARLGLEEPENFEEPDEKMISSAVEYFASRGIHAYVH